MLRGKTFDESDRTHPPVRREREYNGSIRSVNGHAAADRQHSGARSVLSVSGNEGMAVSKFAIQLFEVILTRLSLIFGIKFWLFCGFANTKKFFFTTHKLPFCYKVIYLKKINFMKNIAKLNTLL